VSAYTTVPGTSVPFPTLTTNGFVIPPESAILAGTQADLNAAFGGRLVFTTQSGSQTNPTPAGQWSASEAAIIGNSFAMFLWFCNQVDPAFSQGRMQDAIARIYFITRIPGAPTVVQMTCTGLPNVNIPVGAQAVAIDGNIYVCQAAGTIPQSGSIALPFACSIDGPVVCPAHSFENPPSGIYQAIPGWDTCDNLEDGVLGNYVETRSAFETRRAESTGWSSMGPLGSILGAVYQVPGVVDCYVTENDTNAPAMVGGVSLAPNSLYVAVVGGEASAVAMAIWTRKMPGCAYNGNTFYTVTDPSPQYSPPAPMYTVAWETPTVVDFAVAVVIKSSSSVPFDALTLVQGAIVSAFAGGDGGSRARIGSLVLASRYYPPVMALGSWAQIVDIQLGALGPAFFTGSITGTTLTVTVIASGALAAGQLVLGENNDVANGTTIVSQLTGSAGSTGTYTVSISQPAPVASESMTGTALVNSVQMDIDQVPAVAQNSIALILQ
jgi:Baseplate J-like protein